MDTRPNNYKTITSQYNYINSLRNTNASSDIEIDYNKMDIKSRGELKDRIADALHNYLVVYRESMTDTTKNYIKYLEKANMGYNIKIEYDKFENYVISQQFRESIQLIFIKRARELYLSMTLNPSSQYGGR